MKKLQNNQAFDVTPHPLVNDPGRNFNQVFLAQSIKRALYQGQVARPPKGVKAVPATPMPWWQARSLLWLSKRLPFYLFFEMQTVPGTFTIGKTRSPIIWINARRRMAPTSWAYNETHILHKSKDKVKQRRTGELVDILKHFEKRARFSYSYYIAGRVFPAR